MRILILILLWSPFISAQVGFPPPSNPLIGGTTGQFLIKSSSAHYDYAWATIDPDLLTLAGLTATTDNFIVSVSSAWASRTPAQVKTTLSLENVTNESKATMFTSPTFTGTPVVPGYLPNTATAGVASCPTASGTQTITHNLGRTPVIIDISAVGRFTSNAAATPTPFSNGGWTSSGNSCIYMTTAGTTTQDGLSSSTFAVFIATSSGNNISGVIQNVGATTFDIQWTETGTAAALPFRWKCQ